MTLLGPDLSYCQGDHTDFQPLADVGMAFAIFKATHGQNASAIDPTFRRNWSAIVGKLALIDGVRVPMLRGAYHWFVPEHDPLVQADHACDVIGELAANDLPVSVDFEQKTEIRGLELVARLAECVRRIEARTGKRCIIYTGKWYWREFVGDVGGPDVDFIASRALWHAEYPSSRRVGTEYAAALAALHGPGLPDPWVKRGRDELLWQFDGDGGLKLPSGVDADFNRYRGSYADLCQFIAESRIEPTKQALDAAPPDWQPQTSLATVMPDLFGEGVDPDATDPATPTAKSTPKFRAVNAPIVTSL